MAREAALPHYCATVAHLRRTAPSRLRMPPDSSPDHFDRLGAALAERYTLVRELGRGGMATVYLARDARHDRDVAIKVMR